MSEEEADWAGVNLACPVKKSAISIRLDTDVIDFFKSGGKGYQGRINAVLRHFVSAQSSRQRSAG